MCWHHDIELATKAAAGESRLAEVASVPTVAPVRLTDIELLVGNLYAAGHPVATEKPLCEHSENSGC